MLTVDIRTNERLVQDWATLFSAHDLDTLLELFTDDVIYEDVALLVVNRGKEALRAFGAQFLKTFPDATIELTTSFVTPTHGGAEWVMRGTQMGDMREIPATGKRMEVRGASILEFADNKIRRVSDYWDRMTFVAQLR
jgi:steroid delta-isomerase-like uncharacterized protein